MIYLGRRTLGGEIMPLIHNCSGHVCISTVGELPSIERESSVGLLNLSLPPLTMIFVASTKHCF